MEEENMNICNIVINSYKFSLSSMYDTWVFNGYTNDGELDLLKNDLKKIIEILDKIPRIIKILEQKE